MWTTSARRHRFAVLADVLEREQNERTATETMRQELERAASLATLAPMWADVTRTHATRRYEQMVRSLLAAPEWQRYEQDAERGTLTRLLRAAELAGHDVEDVLRRAIVGRDFGGARSIAAVLHGRVRRLVGTPEPRASASYAERTPAIEDPVADRFARELAAAMDERVSLLGNRAAMDRPVWALAVSRRGACRPDRAGRLDPPSRGCGRLPGRTRIRRRDRSHRARRQNADRRSSERAGTRPMSRCACRTKPGRWLPRQTVSCGLAGPPTSARPSGHRRTSPGTAGGAHRRGHLPGRCGARMAPGGRAVDETERTRVQREAEQSSALAQEVGAYREALTEIAEARRRWHAATGLDRQRALMADTELRRRHPDVELPPLHPEAEAASGADADPDAVETRD